KMRPAVPRFPITQGLSSKAVESRRTVMVPDEKKEPCFLPNFWSTKSEIIVPIIDDEHERVVGVINVESGKLDAFDKADRDFLEGVARLIWRAFRRRNLSVCSNHCSRVSKRSSDKSRSAAVITPSSRIIATPPAGAICGSAAPRKRSRLRNLTTPEITGL